MVTLPPPVATPLACAHRSYHKVKVTLILNFGFRTNRFLNNLLERIVFDNRGLTIFYWERHLAGFPHLGVVDRWPATPKRARIAL